MLKGDRDHGIQRSLQCTWFLGNLEQLSLEVRIIFKTTHEHEGVKHDGHVDQVLLHRSTLLRSVLEGDANVLFHLLATMESNTGSRLRHALGQHNDGVVDGLEIVPRHPEDSIIHGCEVHLLNDLRVQRPQRRGVAPVSVPLRVGTHLIASGIILHLAVRVPDHHQTYLLSRGLRRRPATNKRVGVLQNQPVRSKETQRIRTSGLLIIDLRAHDEVALVVLTNLFPHFVILEWWDSLHGPLRHAGRVPTNVLSPIAVPLTKLCIGADPFIDEWVAREGNECERLRAASDERVRAHKLRHGLLEQRRPHVATWHGKVCDPLQRFAHAAIQVLPDTRHVIIDLHVLPGLCCHVEDPNDIASTLLVHLFEAFLDDGRELSKGGDSSDEPTIPNLTLRDPLW
mmetsp:Transcript_24325/g.63891  ORF Transcript_24325/g.63891 Transcript_24325/m.63891 type:complete len:398 (-) Transcript_24325:948-2141(-)